MVKVYFAGSITGGREFVRYQLEIVRLLKEKGYKVLTEHVSDDKLQKKLRAKAKLSKDYFSYISKHDRKLIDKADMVVAECSKASLGVGFEICYAAYYLKIPVIVLGHKSVKKRFSPIIFGDSSNFIKPYMYNDKNLEKVLSAALAS
jgi:hypothetical protein